MRSGHWFRRGRLLAPLFLVLATLAVALVGLATPSSATIAGKSGALISVPMLHSDVAAVPQGESTYSTASGAIVHAYAPLTTMATLAQAAIGNPTPMPIVMMLHGACGDPHTQCDYWSDGGREGAWLLCPGGNVSCGDNYDWRGSGERKAAHLDDVRAKLRSEHGAQVALGEDILIGFSRGAFAARDIAYARPGQYRGLILIGAHMKPDAQRLKASGIERVVMASGDKDGARGTMVLATALLNKGGLDAKFVSLGDIYHQLPADLDQVVADAIDWIRAPRA